MTGFCAYRFHNEGMVYCVAHNHIARKRQALVDHRLHSIFMSYSTCLTIPRVDFLRVSVVVLTNVHFAMPHDSPLGTACIEYSQVCEWMKSFPCDIS